MLLTLARGQTAPAAWPYKRVKIVDKYPWRSIKTDSEFLIFWRCICVCDGKSVVGDYQYLIELIMQGVYDVNEKESP